MISTNVFAESSVEQIKSTTFSLKNVNVLKDTTLLTVHAPDVNQNKLTMNILSPVTSLLAQESTNTSQPPLKLVSVNLDMSESEESALTVTQDTTMIVTLIDVSVNQDI